LVIKTLHRQKRTELSLVRLSLVYFHRNLRNKWKSQQPIWRYCISYGKHISHLYKYL